MYTVTLSKRAVSEGFELDINNDYIILDPDNLAMGGCLLYGDFVELDFCDIETEAQAKEYAQAVNDLFQKTPRYYDLKIEEISDLLESNFENFIGLDFYSIEDYCTNPKQVLFNQEDNTACTYSDMNLYDIYTRTNGEQMEIERPFTVGLEENKILKDVPGYIDISCTCSDGKACVLHQSNYQNEFNTLEFL